jgi:Glutathione S-transferase
MNGNKPIIGSKKMADNKQKQLTIWGRANSVNVQKVLWCLHELDLAYDRIDAGMQFGKNNEAAYLAMNPNGRVPTLVDGDFVLWESNSVMRYLCLAYGQHSPIYPQDPQRARPSTAGWTGRCRPYSRSIVRCSGHWCARRPKSATWSRIQKDADAEACNGGSSTRGLRRSASSRATNSRSPTSPRRFRAALVRRRGHHQAETGEPRTLVCADRRPSRVCPVHRAADDLISAHAPGRADTDLMCRRPSRRSRSPRP